jgi:hypothetical protein
MFPGYYQENLTAAALCPGRTHAFYLLTGEPYLFLFRILMINLFTVSISSGLLTAMNRVNPARASHC